jgi:hypothetical protein
MVLLYKRISCIAILALAIVCCSASAAPNMADTIQNIHLPGIQSVADAGTGYTNNETIWTNSGNQIITEEVLDNLDHSQGTNPIHYGDGFVFTIQHGKEIYLESPFTSATTRNGKQVRVRNIYFRMRMPVGVNITFVGVNSGDYPLFGQNVVWQGTGVAKTYGLNMKTYKAAPYGLDPWVTVKNTLSENITVTALGTGATLEW